jgi:hypothetical protein
MTSTKNAEWVTAMFQLFVQNLSQGIPLSKPTIMEKAVEMNKIKTLWRSLTQSECWMVGKIKLRPGIRVLSIEVEKLSVGTAEISVYSEKCRSE